MFCMSHPTLGDNNTTVVLKHLRETSSHAIMLDNINPETADYSEKSKYRFQKNNIIWKKVKFDFSRVIRLYASPDKHELVLS